MTSLTLFREAVLPVSTLNMPLAPPKNPRAHTCCVHGSLLSLCSRQRAVSAVVSILSWDAFMARDPLRGQHQPPLSWQYSNSDTYGIEATAVTIRGSCDPGGFMYMRHLPSPQSR
ncbi:unnamed protein product [Scytosiphon promiscuus]